MSSGYSPASSSQNGDQPTIVINVPPQPGFFRSWATRLLISVLVFSLFINFAMMSANVDASGSPEEKFVSGSHTARDRIGIIEISGTIMPPFTERVIKMIDQARDDDTVKGVILSVDSPGGLVADSHQIYHRLTLLSAKKPVYVSMKRMAASGGVYVAMGAGPNGRIFAEPTTWTGSIGVIIPRYDLTGVAEKFGVQSDSLTTGPYKDSLNPFKPLSEDERAVWKVIMDDAFGRFVKIVADGRSKLDEATVREKLATGQVFTANQALENGLIDEIAFEDDVISQMQTDLGLTEVRVFRYSHMQTPLEVLLGGVSASDPEVLWRRTLEATVPRALYYCSWLPVL